MMTEQPKRKRTQRKEASKPEDGVLYITVPDVVDPEEMRTYLEGNFPDWSILQRADKNRLVALMIKNREAPNPVKVSLSRNPDGKVSIDPGGKGSSVVLSTLKLMDAFSATDIDTVNARSSDIIKYLESVGACYEGKYNAALAFVESMAPQDQAQAQLLVQSYITHDAAVRALSQLGTAQMVDHARMYGNLANKLLKTYTTQMDTLMRMQRGNEQVIKHVYVDNRGGQAVFAENVTPPGAGNNQPQQPYGAAATGVCAPMLGADAFGNGVPISGHEGTQALPPSWGSLTGSADGRGERELQARDENQGSDSRAA